MSLEQLLEIPAAFFGFLNVYFAARANIWNWFFGILMVSLYMIIFFQVKLYADMGLQCVFLILQFYGCYQWLYGGEKHSLLLIRRADKKIYLIAFIMLIILFCSIAFILQRFTDSTTVSIDAFTTALSLVAQWMLSQKWLENWLLWIVVDLISINMYFNKVLYVTSVLYGVFLLVAILGFYFWQKKFNENRQLYYAK